MFDIGDWINPHGDGLLMLFGFLISGEQGDKIIDISNNISSLAEVSYVLDNNERLPILRLYEAVFPEKNLEQVKISARNVASMHATIKMKWAEVEESEDVVILWGELNKELIELQYALMNELSSLREGYYKQKYNTYELDPMSQDSLRRWGWVWGSDYSPYVVISRPKKKYDLRDFEITWGYRYYHLNEFVIALKTGPGTLTHREVINLK